MNEYVLVCLVGDVPTTFAAQFAEWMHKQRPATALLQNPTGDVVKNVVSHSRTLVVLGHDGALEGVHSMRSRRDGDVWMRGAEFGERFPGVRLYLWGCDTMGSGSTRSTAIADEAKESGAARVAGHSVTLSADFDQLAGPHANVFRESLARLVWGFADGEDDARRLRLRAREALLFDLELDASTVESLVWFQRKQWLDDRIANFHVA